ncbi:MAG: hypothetical protein KJ061_05810 [Vicinamibacteraceae bacterium]|nr:hypothetical protein [Vicinamibacteraceae bacterium]
MPEPRSTGSADTTPPGAHPPWLRTLGLDRGWGAFVFFAAASLVVTWPLARGLVRDTPWDHGDALLICWILGWNAHVFLRTLTGEPTALLSLWHANIFYPERYTLAYSETMIAPGLQALPVYALADNLVLAYNLQFLASYALSGLAMYLFVRAVTGDWRAGLVAGAVYGFMPYRVEQGPHLQVLSSQWMPLALYGFRRWFDTGRTRALAGAAAALVVQHLTCGYYMIFFAPFVPAYVLWELATRGRLLEWRSWRALVLAGLGIAAFTLPAMWPYLALRDIHHFERGLGESVSFSADVLAWFTAPSYLNFWGPRLALYSVGEGHLFPGALALLLAAAGALGGLVAIARSRPASPPARGAAPYVRGVVAVAGAGVALVHGVAFLLLLFGSNRIFWVAGQKVSLDPANVLLMKTAAGVAATLVVAGWRRSVAAWLARPSGFFTACLVGAWWLSLGPDPHAWGHSIGIPGPYRLLFEYVPGASGLRVPARFAMVAMIFLAALAGLGFRRLPLHRPRHAIGMAMAVALIVMAESAAWPLPLNERLAVRTHLVPPPKRLRTGWNPTPLSRWLALQDDRLVLAQFPFGEMAWEIHYVYDSTAHFTPMLNGYSGWFPPTYARLSDVLMFPLDEPDRAWQALAQSGATHAVVHRSAYRREAWHDVERWLLEHGARRIANLANVQIFSLPRR